MATVLGLTYTLSGYSQSDAVGTTNILNFQYNFTPKWSAFTEFQLRSDKFFKDFNYDEIKLGASYNVANHLGVLLGFGQYNTYSFGGSFKQPFINREKRLWEQFSLYNTIGRLKLEHRYRIEQRWLTQGFRNRFRYRVNTILSLRQPKINAGAIYAYVNDEIFLTDLPGYFQRNRFYVGLGDRIIKQLTIQMGYLHQFDYANNHKSVKNFFQTSFLFTMHSQRSLREMHPATTD